jgi:hypothetical protein
MLGEEYKLWSFSLCRFLQTLGTSSLFDPNIFSITLFYKHPQSLYLPQGQRSSFTPIQSNRQNFSFVYSNFSRFYTAAKKTSFRTEWKQALSEFRLLLISSWVKIWFLTVVPKYLNYVTFSKDLLAFFMSWFCLAFWWRDSNTNLVFFAFTSICLTSLFFVHSITERSISSTYSKCYGNLQAYHHSHPSLCYL